MLTWKKYDNEYLDSWFQENGENVCWCRGAVRSVIWLSEIICIIDVDQNAIVGGPGFWLPLMFECLEEESSGGGWSWWGKEGALGGDKARGKDISLEQGWNVWV